MKIASIQTIPIAIPHEHGGPLTGFGGSSWPTLSVLLVKVDTDDGYTGWGEAFSYGCIAAVKAVVEETIAPLALGRDAADIAGISRDLQQGLHLFGRYGITMFGISAVDIALWDIAGKRAGLPLSGLLGAGTEAIRIPGYASLLKYGDPELVAQHSSEAVDAGYTMLKLHETGVPEVRAARSAVGSDVSIAVDTNCPWSLREANEMAAKFCEFSPFWLEEPIFPPEDFQALASLRQSSGVRLAAGENACTSFQFAHMFASRAVDFAQPSVTKVGGVTEMRKVAALAETHGVTVVPHSPYFGPGWLASLAVLRATPSPGWVERFYTKLEATLYPGFTDPDKHGCFLVPSGPGLGIEPDPDVLRDYRVNITYE